jgi:hypothetical protein
MNCVEKIKLILEISIRVNILKKIFSWPALNSFDTIYQQINDIQEPIQSYSGMKRKFSNNFKIKLGKKKKNETIIFTSFENLSNFLKEEKDFERFTIFIKSEDGNQKQVTFTSSSEAIYILGNKNAAQILYVSLKHKERNITYKMELNSGHVVFCYLRYNKNQELKLTKFRSVMGPNEYQIFFQNNKIKIKFECPTKNFSINIVNFSSIMVELKEKVSVLSSMKNAQISLSKIKEIIIIVNLYKIIHDLMNSFEKNGLKPYEILIDCKNKNYTKEIMIFIQIPNISYSLLSKYQKLYKNILGLNYINDENVSITFLSNVPDELKNNI